MEWPINDTRDDESAEKISGIRTIHNIDGHKRLIMGDTYEWFQSTDWESKEAIYSMPMG